MPSYDHAHRVRYRECDPMGIVYHTHYLDYFEAARTEALREMGVAYKDLETAGVIMPVIDVAMRFKQSARYDDLLTIRAIFADTAPRTRLRIDYEVFRHDDPTLLVTGHVTLCFFDVERGRPIVAPSQIQDVFTSLIG